MNHGLLEARADAALTGLRCPVLALQADLAIVLMAIDALDQEPRS